MMLATDEHKPMVPIPQEIIVGAVAFALLCMVLMRFVFPRMEAMLAARVEAIEGGVRKAAETQAEAGRLLEQYKAQLAEARAEATRIRNEAHADGVGMRDDLLAEAREESERIIAAGKEQLQSERQSIARELRAGLGRHAVDLASKIAGEALADEMLRSGTVELLLTEPESEHGVEGAGAR